MIEISMRYKTFKQLKLKTKLLVIYLAGFLIPIFTINIFLSYNIYQDEIEYNKSNLQNRLSTTAVLIQSEFSDVLQLINSIYINKELYTFISSRYSSINEYLKARTYFFQSDSIFNQLRSYNVNFKIYTINELTNPDPIFTDLNRVKHQLWYREFSQSKRVGYIYYSRTNPNVISVIRALDYRMPIEHRFDNILRVDIPLSKIEEHLNSFPDGNGISFISPKNEVVFSNRKAIEADYTTFESISGIRMFADWKLEGRLNNKRFLLRFTSGNRLKSIILVFLVILIGTLLIYILSKSFYTRIYNLSLCMRSVKYGKFTSAIQSIDYGDEISELYISYNIMVNKIETLISEIAEERVRVKDIELSRNQAQLDALMSQINPHYLFNVLESIRMRSIIKGEKESANIIKHLSRSFRNTLSWDEALIPLKKEIEIITDFLVVQKYRFGEKLNYTIYCSDSLKEIMIPKFTIQPFIENSAIHGVEKSTNPGEIVLDISKIGNFLKIVIKDNGIGIPPDKLINMKNSMSDMNIDCKHIGFINTYWRLKKIYKDFSLNISSEINKGTEITLNIPLEEF